MWVRKRLEIGWTDLVFAAIACLSHRNAEQTAARIEATVGADGGAFVCLSVRSGFDLLLTALRLPPGSEVLVSAITIPDMARIIADHGLVAMPVDLDPRTAGPTLQTLERARSVRTRAVLVVHLFGGRLPLNDLLQFARDHHLIVVEDCAQAFEGDGWFGTPAADVSLFSFGTIKTATALGGAIVRVREPTILAQMRTIHATWPRQSRWRYLLRVLKYGLLKFLSGPILFGALYRAYRMLGLNFDQRMDSAVRGFAGADRENQFRRRPVAPLLAVLKRRMSADHTERIAARRRCGNRMLGGLRSAVLCPGSELAHHSFWVFPVCVDQPARLIDRLRQAGFDATQGQSLHVVPVPTDRPELEAVVARRMLQEIVFLPCYPGLLDAEAARLTDEIVRFQSVPAGTRCIE